MTNEDLVAEIQQKINVNENMQQLYHQNERMIYTVIKPYIPYSECDDLMQEAYFGLCRAVELYEPKEEVLFITYAIHWIKQTASRYVMNTGRTKRIPVHMVSLVSKYKKFIADYEKQHQKKPTDKEICIGLGISEKRLNNLGKIEHEMNCYSTDAIMTGADDLTYGDMIPSETNIEEEITEYYARKANEAALWGIIETLDKRKSEVITERYRHNKSLKECGKQFNVSGERIRRIEKDACQLLKEMDAVKKIALEYDYNLSTVYKWGVGRFKNSNTSSTEHWAIVHSEQQKEIQNGYVRIKKEKKALRKKYLCNQH